MSLVLKRLEAGFGLLKSQKLIEFDEVRADLLKEAAILIDESLSSSQPTLRPTLIHLCGIPGSGKTTYASFLLEQHHGFASVQFDAVMEKLLGYQRDKAELGLMRAFSNWELPARAIGYHLLQVLLEERRNVLFDHSASAATHLKLIDQICRWGYRVEMHHLVCPVATALQRIALREKILHRHTPEHLVFERVGLIEELLPQYKARVNRFIEVSNDNNGGFLDDYVRGDSVKSRAC